LRVLRNALVQPRRRRSLGFVELLLNVASHLFGDFD